MYLIIVFHKKKIISKFISISVVNKTVAFYPNKKIIITAIKNAVKSLKIKTKAAKNIFDLERMVTAKECWAAVIIMVNGFCVFLFVTN